MRRTRITMKEFSDSRRRLNPFKFFSLLVAVFFFSGDSREKKEVPDTMRRTRGRQDLHEESNFPDDEGEIRICL